MPHPEWCCSSVVSHPCVAARKNRPKHHLQKITDTRPAQPSPASRIAKTRHRHASPSIPVLCLQSIGVLLIIRPQPCRSSGSAPTSRPWARRSLARQPNKPSNPPKLNNSLPAADSLAQQLPRTRPRSPLADPSSSRRTSPSSSSNSSSSPNLRAVWGPRSSATSHLSSAETPRRCSSKAEVAGCLEGVR